MSYFNLGGIPVDEGIIGKREAVRLARLKGKSLTKPIISYLMESMKDKENKHSEGSLNLCRSDLTMALSNKWVSYEEFKPRAVFPLITSYIDHPDGFERTATPVSNTIMFDGFYENSNDGRVYALFMSSKAKNKTIGTLEEIQNSHLVEDFDKQFIVRTQAFYDVLLELRPTLEGSAVLAYHNLVILHYKILKMEPWTGEQEEISRVKAIDQIGHADVEDIQENGLMCYSGRDKQKLGVKALYINN